MTAEAEQLFGEVFANWTSRWSIVWGFRRYVVAGAPLASRVITRWTDDLAETFMTSPEYADVAASLEGRRFLAQSIRDSAGQSIRTAQASAGAASLVFAHAVVDAAAFDYCRVSALASPSDWTPYVKGKQVKLQEVLAAAPDALFDQALQKHLTDLEMRSMLTKIDTLFAVCQTPPGFAPMSEYSYDRDRIASFDSQRHAIVHGPSLDLDLDSVEPELDYLCRTCMFMLCMVNWRYGLKLIG